jgi:hypothetical protein
MEEVLKFENREQLYSFLIDDFGLIKVKEKYDPEAFGNFFIILSANDFLLKYINDRSFLTIEIASQVEPSQWYSLSFIRDYIYNPENMNADDGESDNATRVKDLNDFLRKDFGLISDLFNKDNYKDTQQKLNKLLKQQFDRRFK